MKDIKTKDEIVDYVKTKCDNYPILIVDRLLWGKVVGYYDESINDIVINTVEKLYFYRIPFYIQIVEMRYMVNFTETSDIIRHATSYNECISDYERKNIDTYLLLDMV